jgi:hypothetical protein
MRAPVAAYGLVFLLRRWASGAITLATLGLPIAPDPNILAAVAILLP